MNDCKCPECGSLATKVYDLGTDKARMYCYACGGTFYRVSLSKTPEDQGDRLRELANVELGQMFLSAGEGKGA